MRRRWRSHSPKEISSTDLLSVDIDKGGLPLGASLKRPMLISTCITFCIPFGVMGIGSLWLNDGQIANANQHYKSEMKRNNHEL